MAAHCGRAQAHLANVLNLKTIEAKALVFKRLKIKYNKNKPRPCEVYFYLKS
ncbi:hypothetical protein GCM10007922_21570 [Shewanella decolorationis]|nr:hypothetical protein GCM10007922_21570 [Shewanella decolorationis]